LSFFPEFGDQHDEFSPEKGLFRFKYIIPMNLTLYKIPVFLGKLKKFIEDLHSGKLHREFHYGADPEESTPEGGGSH
jgi:hypothetical protein